MEERCGVLEECERLFASTKLRLSTEHVGLVRLPGGLELVRVGKPLGPELAIWRYGELARSRRQRTIGKIVVTGVLSLVVGSTVMFTQDHVWTRAVALLGAIGGTIGALLLGGTVMELHERARRVMHDWQYRAITRFGELRMEKEHALAVRVIESDDNAHGWKLHVPHANGVALLDGADALRIAAAVLPVVNPFAASRAIVTDAARLLDESPNKHDWFRKAARARYGAPVIPAEVYEQGGDNELSMGNLQLAGPRTLLILEMIANEETERRAMAGELGILEATWRQAEEIASIADRL